MTAHSAKGRRHILSRRVLAVAAAMLVIAFALGYFLHPL
jgi:preprotein translocase subunit SecG